MDMVISDQYAGENKIEHLPTPVKKHAGITLKHLHQFTHRHWSKSMTQPETIKVGQLKINYLIDGTASGGMGMFELTVPPGSNVPPPHSHSKNDECVYVIEGSCAIP